MSSVVSLPLKKSRQNALILPKRRKKDLLAWLLIVSVVLTILATVFLTVKTQELMHQHLILESKISSLKAENISLKKDISTKFNPVTIEENARKNLNMEFSIFATDASVVFLKADDALLAAIGVPSEYGKTEP